MKKKLKKNGQVKRLVNLEVDEVSLVDKPAIGEEIYVTKSQGGHDVAKKKLLKVKKAEGEEENKPGEAASAAPAVAADPASEEGEEEEGAEAAAEGEEEDSEEEGSEEGEDDGEEEGEEEPEAEGDVAKRLVTVEKNLADVQEMLATSLDFHEQAAESLNQVVQITMMALDMLMEMDAEAMPEAEAAGEGEAATEMSAAAKGVAEVRGLIKKFQTDVQKAGAKISSSRLSILREIATKLTELLSSVEADGKKAGKKTKKATSADMDSLKQQVADLKKSLLDSDSERTELKKTVDEQANRLNGIEASAGGASAGIGDDDGEEDDSESEDGTQTKSKSVFAGLIPVDEIKEQTRKRSEFLNRKREKETVQS